MIEKKAKLFSSRSAMMAPNTVGRRQEQDNSGLPCGRPRVLQKCRLGETDPCSLGYARKDNMLGIHSETACARPSSPFHHLILSDQDPLESTVAATRSQSWFVPLRLRTLLQQRHLAYPARWIQRLAGKRSYSFRSTRVRTRFVL